MIHGIDGCCPTISYRAETNAKRFTRISNISSSGVGFYGNCYETTYDLMVLKRCYRIINVRSSEIFVWLVLLPTRYYQRISLREEYSCLLRFNSSASNSVKMCLIFREIPFNERERFRTVARRSGDFPRGKIDRCAAGFPVLQRG